MNSTKRGVDFYFVGDVLLSHARMWSWNVFFVTRREALLTEKYGIPLVTVPLSRARTYSPLPRWRRRRNSFLISTCGVVSERLPDVKLQCRVQSSIIRTMERRP